MKELQTNVERAIASFRGHSSLIPVEELFKKLVSLSYEVELADLKRFIELHPSYKLVPITNGNNQRITWYVHTGIRVSAEPILKAATQVDLHS